MMVMTGGKVSGYILDNAQDFGCQNCEKPDWNCFSPQIVLVNIQVVERTLD